MKIVYLDNNATTKTADEVVNEMMPYLGELYANPSSLYSFGSDCRKRIDMAREQVAALINAEPEEIVFTSCGTESDNAAIWGILKANPSKRHIVTTRVEHPAVKNLYEYLHKIGYQTVFLPVDEQGRLDMDELKASLTPDTAIVSIMWANNETGVLFPIEETSEILNQKGIIFHTDAVQAVGKVPIDLKTHIPNLLSLSGHKFHAPKGIGALYIRKGTPFIPFLLGGHQEKNRRAGTENVASIIGLGKASEIAAEHLNDNISKIKKLRDKLENGILKGLPHVYINGDMTRRLPNTANISFENVDGEVMILLLNEYGICASSGAACNAGLKEPSRILSAMGVPFNRSRGSIRFSLSRYTTEEEIDYAIEKISSVVAQLRSNSILKTDIIDNAL